MSETLMKQLNEDLEAFNPKKESSDMEKEVDDFFDKYLNHESLKEDKFMDLVF